MFRGSGRLHDEQERRTWQNPEAILDEIGLKSGMTFMDIGCGQGFFSIPAAKIAGEKGTVYALDINPDNITKLQQKAASAGLTNIVMKSGKAEDEKFCQACADIVFMGIVLHDFEDPLRVLANAHLMLKPTGILANLDWKKISTPMGPPVNIRFDEDMAKRLIESQGLKVTSIKDWGAYHYLVIAAP